MYSAHMASSATNTAARQLSCFCHNAIIYKRRTNKMLKDSRSSTFPPRST